MRLWGNPEEKEVDKLKLQLETTEAEVDTLKNRVKIRNAKIEDQEEKLSYYIGLENDRKAIEREKRKVSDQKIDLEDNIEIVDRRLERVKQKEAALEVQQNDQYKSGYSDGVADGLRKAHDITREDRKYMTMMAMASNQSKAIETAQKALGDGYKDDSRNSQSK